MAVCAGVASERARTLTDDASSRYRIARALFEEVCDLPVGTRETVLNERCGDDPELRHEVEALLRHDARDSGLDGLGRDALARALVAETRADVFAAEGYTILEEVGRGGTATVYRAAQESPARDVAIKVINPRCMTSQALSRFRQEAQILARLSHPGIAQVYGATIESKSENDGAAFIVMEFVSGLPVLEHVRANDLPIDARIRLLISICEAVQYAHQFGIIHRDLKSANILIDADGTPKVLDFGVARLTERSGMESSINTFTGQIMGSLETMSPEQLDGHPDAVDTRADVYALGVLMYQILADRTPIDVSSGSLASVVDAIRSQTPPLLGTVDRRFRGDLETIAARAAGKDRERRYPTAEALAADLARHLAGEPIDARRDSTLYVLGRQLRRYRVPVALVATIMIILAFSTVLFLVQSQASRQVADRERTARQTAELERSRSNVERARLMSAQGNLGAARRLVEAELARFPDSPHTYWGFLEVLSRFPIRHGLPTAGAESVLEVVEGQDLIVAACDNGRAFFWRISTGALCFDLDLGPIPLVDVRSSADGQRVFLLSGDGALAQVNVVERTLAWRRDGTGDEFHSMAISPDETLVVLGNGTGNSTGNGTGGAEVRRLDSGALLAAVQLEARVDDIEFVADRDFVVALYGGPMRRMSLDEATGSLREVWRAAPEGKFRDVDISPDGATIAACGLHKTIKLYDTNDGAEIGAISHTNGANLRVEFAADGRSLWVRGWNGFEHHALDRPSGPALWVIGVPGADSFALDHERGLVIASQATAPYDVQVLDDRPYVLARELVRFDGVACTPAVAEDGRTVAAGGCRGADVGRLVVVDGPTGNIMIDRRVADHPINDVEFTLDQEALLVLVGTPGNKSELLLFDLASGQTTVIDRHVQAYANYLDRRSMTSTVAAVRRDELVTFDERGTDFQRIMEHRDGFTPPVFSPDGTRIAIGALDGVFVMNSDGSEVDVFEMQSGRPRALAFSPSGRTLGVTRFDQKVEFIDLKKQTWLGVGEAQRGSISSICAFELNGATLFATCTDDTIGIWDPVEAVCLAVLGSGRGIRSVPGTPILLTGGDAVRWWDLTRSEQYMSGIASPED